MGRSRTISDQLLVTLLLLVLYPRAESQWLHHQPLPPVNLPPLCASQFALADRACAALPYTPGPPPTPPSPTPDPPAPPSADEPESGNHHRHHRGHRHSRHEGHQETQIEADCCRWLKEIDDVCVCEVLVRLPVFLTRPVHEYTLMVDDSCEVSFSCGSRLKPL